MDLSSVLNLSSTAWVAIGAAITVVLLLYRQNAILRAVPHEIAEHSPRRWTRAEIREAYERLVKTPLDFRKILPPKLERKYVVVGGSGLVGGDIVAQLLQQGHSPESIRIVDFAPPKRAALLTGAAAEVEVVKADITSPASLEAAFSKPWAASAASLPLTVYHTAAVIRPWERFQCFYDRVHSVNVNGTANVLQAARDAGADIFIATASGSIAVRPVSFWVWPWRSAPVGYAQFFDESDFDRPLRGRADYFANYALAKAQAERMVCSANAEGFRTGTIRPVNGVYGDASDLCLDPLLTIPVLASWTPHIVQNFVNSRNVALGHLQLEAALARPAMPRCAGRTFNVTDDGLPPSFTDLYNTVFEVAEKKITLLFPPPLVVLVTAHLIEAWCLLLAYAPFLKALGLGEPGWPVAYMQPSVFSVCSHTIGFDSAARRSVEDGGIGYTPGCTTMEGFCQQVREWNVRTQGTQAGSAKVRAAGKVAQMAVDAGLTPVPVAA
ncbi:NAD(P)-binding protein [Thozetella sp. PMI_491]|nr:NAD(P)-binding protein [Thozetella sp. PMI_491]